MWYKHPIIVIDFETTGVDAATCMPVEVAAARFEDGKCVAVKSSLCNPGIPIPEGASAVHGIFDKDVADAPESRAAIAAVILGVAGKVSFDFIPHFAAYNAPYDATIFRRFSHIIMGPWLDPLVWVRAQDKYTRGKGRHTLTAACERRGIVAQGAHRALADATMAGALLWSADIFKRLGERSLADVLTEQEALAKIQNAEFEAFRNRVSQ